MKAFLKGTLVLLFFSILFPAFSQTPIGEEGVPRLDYLKGEMEFPIDNVINLVPNIAFLDRSFDSTLTYIQTQKTRSRKRKFTPVKRIVESISIEIPKSMQFRDDEHKMIYIEIKKDTIVLPIDTSYYHYDYKFDLTGREISKDQIVKDE